MARLGNIPILGNMSLMFTGREMLIIRYLPYSKRHYLLNKLLLSILLLLIGYQSSAQVVLNQTVDSKFASALAENPAKVLTDGKFLRGFGSFLIVDRSDENYDNLVGFYDVDKEELFGGGAIQQGEK